MATADAIFHQADTNQDQRLDLNEFRNLLGSSVSNYSASGDLSAAGASGSYGSSSTMGAGYSGDISYSGAGLSSGGFGGSSYESSSSSSYGSSMGGAGGDLTALGVGAGNVSAAGVTDLSSANYSSTSETVGIQRYETDAQGLFKDPNPQVVRRPAPGGGVTYTQNIRVRFLQPPPVPPPGPLIIKEVRPPQPPAPPPLRIRQQAPPLPQPAPLILRERPPVPPASSAAQTVIRRLAALPVPPRSVIIERLPALPPRPRDIIIERWIPYGQQAKRRTIVQRAAAAQQYAAPRNVIIQYEPVQVRVVRQFQRLGVVQENPQVYFQRYGASLLDAQTLVQQARAAGVVEDISPPAIAGSFSAGSSEFASSTGSLGYETAGSFGGASGFESYDAGSAGFGGSGGYQSSYSETMNTSGLGTDLGVSGLVGTEFGGSTSYGSTSGSTSGSAVDAAFNAADTNRDGVLSQGEFRAAGF